MPNVDYHIEVERHPCNVKAHPTARPYNRRRPAEMRRVREITIEHEAVFLERWNEYFSR